MNIFAHNLFTKLIISIALVGIWCVPVSLTGKLQTAQAQGFLVYDVQNTLTNTLQTLSTVALEQKEIVWDTLFYNIAKTALQQMTRDIIAWVNSGFDGNPAFVTDLNGYLLTVADEVAGDFIYGEDLSSLCKPFQLDVRIALALHYQEEQYGGFEEQAACTLEEYTDDMTAFLNGDFNAGGWDAWFEIALNPENTPLGARLAAESELAARIEAEQAEQVKQLEFGNGFFSMEVCTGVDTGSGLEENCTIATPGVVIQQQLSEALAAPLQGLIEADEMNEILGQLFSALANQAITGVNGLLGLGGNESFTVSTFGANGNLSFLDAISEQNAQQNSANVAGNRIAQALQTESRVLELELEIVSHIDEVIGTYTAAAKAHEGGSCFESEVPQDLKSKLDELLAKIPETIGAVMTLQELNDQYEQASSNSAQAQILQQFTALQSEQVLSGQTAVIQYENYLNTTLQTQIDAFEAEIEEEEASC